MNASSAARSLRKPVAAGRPIIAYTREDELGKAVRTRAVALAKAAEAPDILYDADAAGYASPLPTNWSGEGAEQLFGDPLDEHELEVAGRHELARQVRRLLTAGVQAFGWLPSEPGPAALVEYAQRHGAAALVVPSGLAELAGLEDQIASTRSAEGDPLASIRLELMPRTEKGT